MVNTFIVSTNLKKNFKILDRRRLGKQRLECLQIINALEGTSTGYINHSATKAFYSENKKELKNNIKALKIYYNYCLREWIKRGYKNSMEFYTIYKDIDKDTYEEYTSYNNRREGIVYMPWFFSYRPFILSHQASLLRKEKDYYKEYFVIDEILKPYMDKGYLWSYKYEPNPEFNFNMLESLHDYTKEEIIKWIKDKTKNPKTNRTIKYNTKKDSIYYKLDQARIFYDL